MNFVQPVASAGQAARHGWLPYALLTIAMVIYGSNYVLGRGIRGDIPPVALAFWRAVVACALLAPFVWSDLRRSFPALIRDWRLLLMLSATQTIIGQTFLFGGLHSTTAINAALVAALQPIFIILVAVALIGERMNNRQRFGIAVGAFGGLIAIAHGEIDTLVRVEFVIGDLLVLIATVAWSFYSVLVKRVSSGINPFVVFFAFTFIGVVVLLPAHVAEVALLGAYFDPTAEVVGAILYIAVFNSIIALVFLNIGIARLGPSRASVFYYLMPVSTAFFAVVALNEAIKLYHFIALGFVVAGVFLTSGLSWSRR